MPDKEGKYGYYASGRPRPKPAQRKVNPVRRLFLRWWNKAIEKWRRGKVLVEKEPSMRAAMRRNRIGVEGHAKSSMAQMTKAKARFYTHKQVWIEGKGWVTQERVPQGMSLAERRVSGKN